MNVGPQLSDGQLVTLLVGIGLELLPLHEAGHAYGPIHPAHVIVDTTGRPGLADVARPPGWAPHDDWVALLRLGRHLGASTLGRELSWETASCLEGVDLLQWLMRWSTPRPLPPGDVRVGSESMLLH